MPPLPESSLAPTTSVFDPDPLPSLVGTARIEAAAFALCDLLAAHRPDPFVDTSHPHIAGAIGGSLLAHFSQDRRTEDLVAGIERASGHLAFGLANFSHQALNRAYAEFDRTLAPSDDHEAARVMRLGLIVTTQVLTRVDTRSPLRRELRELAVAAFADAFYDLPRPAALEASAQAQAWPMEPGDDAAIQTPEIRGLVAI
jgi:hypothetical protein